MSCLTWVSVPRTSISSLVMYNFSIWNLFICTVSLLYDLAGGSACRRGPCDIHCISPLISLWRPHPTSAFTRAAVWLVFQTSSHVNKIKKCLVLLAVSSKCLRIHYNKEYSRTIRMLLHHKVYKTNPHTLDELKQNIRTEINAISEAGLMRVNANFLRRCSRYIDAEGQHFQHLLW